MFILTGNRTFLSCYCAAHRSNPTRNQEKLRPYLNQPDFDRVHGSRFLETQEELEAFERWCRAHKVKELRGVYRFILWSRALMPSVLSILDWLKDKDSRRPWFWPSINKNFTRIPAEQWDLLPSSTNLNESSHPLTNQNTGVNLPLLEAIIAYVS